MGPPYQRCVHLINVTSPRLPVTVYSSRFISNADVDPIAVPSSAAEQRDEVRIQEKTLVQMSSAPTATHVHRSASAAPTTQSERNQRSRGGWSLPH